MFTKSPSSSVKTFAVFAFILLAGGIITVLTLQTSNSDSQDIRSRAANPETILKEWNFTGGSTAGWTAGSGVTVSVPSQQRQTYPPTPGYLEAKYTAKGTDISADAGAPLIFLAETLQAPVGIKKFRIWLRVTVPTVQKSDSVSSKQGVISKNQPKALVKTYPFKFSLQYLKKTGATWKWSKVATFTGTTEQGFKEFVIPWEDSLSLQADRFRLVFNQVGASAVSTVQIQKIQVAVEKVPATPTPTLTPTPTIGTFEGIVRMQNPPTPTPSSGGRQLMLAQAPNYLLVVADKTYLLTFDTKQTTTPQTTFGSNGTVSRGSGGTSAGMQLYVTMSSMVGCKVTVSGVSANTGTQPSILVSSVQKTGACGL